MVPFSGMVCASGQLPFCLLRPSTVVATCVAKGTSPDKVTWTRWSSGRDKDACISFPWVFKGKCSSSRRTCELLLPLSTCSAQKHMPRCPWWSDRSAGPDENGRRISLHSKECSNKRRKKKSSERKHKKYSKMVTVTDSEQSPVAIAEALGFPPGIDSKSLLLKTPHAWAATSLRNQAGADLKISSL